MKLKQIYILIMLTLLMQSCKKETMNNSFYELNVNAVSLDIKDYRNIGFEVLYRLDQKNSYPLIKPENVNRENLPDVSIIVKLGYKKLDSYRDKHIENLIQAYYKERLDLPPHNSSKPYDSPPPRTAYYALDAFNEIIISANRTIGEIKKGERLTMFFDISSSNGIFYNSYNAFVYKNANLEADKEFKKDISMYSGILIPPYIEVKISKSSGMELINHLSRGEQTDFYIEFKGDNSFKEKIISL